MNPAPLLHWIKEREAIRLRRLAGEDAPWTQDRILQQYRFCNVRRKHDRVSQWIINNVLMLPMPPGSLGERHFWMFLALCRWVNWPPTIQAWLDKRWWPSPAPDWQMMGDYIDQRAASGEQAWTGAFMVRGEQKSHGHPWAYWGKGRYVACIVVKRELELAAHRILRALRERSRATAAEVLRACYGWGPFMAGQVVDDWSWTPLLRDATDHYAWAPQGPGSVRGLNRLLGRPLAKPFGEAEWCAHLVALRSQVIQELGGDFADMTLMDLQNCLCETDKYERVRLGEGRPRSLYKPETAY
jgi:hypothetical protein